MLRQEGRVQGVVCHAKRAWPGSHHDRRRPSIPCGTRLCRSLRPRERCGHASDSGMPDDVRQVGGAPIFFSGKPRAGSITKGSGIWPFSSAYCYKNIVLRWLKFSLRIAQFPFSTRRLASGKQGADVPLSTTYRDSPYP
ncbi:protein of unknown function [Pararobbsia alpina]